MASKNLDRIRLFARRENPQPILQRLLFRNRFEQFLELFKKLVGICNAERLWNSVAIEHIKRSFAGVAMAVSNASKFCVADFCRAAKGPINNGATHLQRAQIGLGKSMTGKINRGNRESLIIERG